MSPNEGHSSRWISRQRQIDHGEMFGFGKLYGFHGVNEFSVIELYQGANAGSTEEFLDEELFDAQQASLQD